ncbi:MAG: CHASE2 domain-containing protein [Gammaproteobacteria bacterium]
MLAKYKGITDHLLFNFLVAAMFVAASADYGEHTAGLVDRLEKITFDWRILRDAESARRKNDDIVIIDIDSGSLRALGGWPWRRDTLGDMTRQLFDYYNVRAAGFTFPFPLENDDAVVALGSVRDELLAEGDIGKKARQQLTMRLDTIAGQFDYDALFAESLRGRAVLLGYAFDGGGHAEASLPVASRLYAPSNPPLPMDGSRARWATGGFLRMSGYDGNIAQLNDSAAGGGHLNVEVDKIDGIVRRAPAVVLHEGARYESLAIALMRHDNAGEASLVLHEDMSREATYGLVVGKGSPLVLHQDVHGKAERLRTNRYTFEIDADATMLLRFGNTGGQLNFDAYESAAFRYIPAGDVIRGDAPKEYLDGKLAIIGSSAGLPRSVYPTAVNARMPLAEIVAWQVDAARRGDTLFRKQSTRLTELALLALAAAVLAVASVFAGPVLSFLLAGGLAGGGGYFVLQQWQEYGEVFRMAPLMIVFGGMAVVNILSYFVFESVKGRRLRSTFSQYVPPELAKQMDKAVNMESESREVSVLFSDIRNFTTIAEKLTPKELASLMNKMLTAQTRVIYQNGGTVDKFIGDAVMAFWNAPLADKNHAKNAVSAALGLRRAIMELSDAEEKAGRSPMRLGIGISTGVVNVGNMGSEFRIAYTAVGDTVNVSSRAEGLTKHYGVPILATESTKEQCGDAFVFRAVDKVRVKGREQAIMIYEPVGRRGDVPDTVVSALAVFGKMRAAYEGGDFSLALDLLHEYERAMPEDALSIFYGKRINSLLKSSPRHWDGVTTFDNK